MTEKKMVNFKLDKATWRELRHAAVDEDDTVSGLLRRLVQKHLRERDPKKSKACDTG